MFLWGYLKMHMSMSQIPILSVSLEQAITDIINSIAMEEAALSNILNSEGEIIQKTKNVACDVDELVSVNESVNSIIKNVARLQMLIQFKLEDAEKLLQKIMDFNEDEDLEE